MTVPVPGSLTYSYDEDGVTTVFPYPVRFLEPQELTVIREVAGAQTVLAYNVDYTVSGAGNPSGGSITRTAVTDGGKIIIARSTAWKQIVDLEDKARNPAEAVELQMDRLTMAGQDVDRRVGVVEVQAAEIDDAVRRSEEAAEAAESAEQAAEEAAEAAQQAAGSVQWPVSYGISQSLSTSQRLQAQANIGGVSYADAQGLSPSDQQQARENIDAASLEDVIANRDTRNFCWAGGFDWWRSRGASIPNTTGRILTADGWTIGRSSSATGVTVSQQQGSRGNNLCARIQRVSGNAGTQTIAFVHNLGFDDSRPMIGKEVTLSFRVRGGADFSASTFNTQIMAASGIVEQAIILTNGNYSSGGTTVASDARALSQDWQDVVIGGTVPADASQVAIRFTCAPVGTAGAADYFEIEEVQLVLGSSAPPYLAVDPAYSLMKAQRQFWKTYNDDVAPGTVDYNGALRATSIGTTAVSAVQIMASFPAMRAVPTITAYSPQTGASGKMAKGSAADVDASILNIGKGGCGIANTASVTASAIHYVHVTAEARL